MNYRTLGNTALRVSVLSYGASPLGSVFRDIDKAEGIRTVHTALDLGINYIDVSPFYGMTRAETVLGEALSSVPRDRYCLATKLGRYGPQDFDFSAARVVRSVEESLQRLQVDYIDIMQCHDIEFGSLQQIIDETLPALQRMREQGKVRFIGITGLPLKVFPAIMDHAPVDTVLSYCHYALNDTSLTTLIPYFQQKGIGIVGASPLSMGLLTRRGPPQWHPAPAEIKAACAKAAEYCDSQGVDIAQLAVQFALANPDIHTTLTGTANAENLKKNVAWIEQPLDTQLLNEVLEILKPIHNRTWPSGRPENN
jgi:aryl-alcohol dehydrogenase-like predicted oxidoreductase